MSIKINSICFNQDGDPAAGSLHCRVDGNKPIPPRFELGTDCHPWACLFRAHWDQIYL